MPIFIVLGVYNTLWALVCLSVLPDFAKDRKAAEAVLATLCALGSGFTAFYLWSAVL